MKHGIRHFKLFGKTVASYGWCTLYTGTGYATGLGFDMEYKALIIGRLKIITDLKFSSR